MAATEPATVSAPPGRRPVIDYVGKDYESFKQGMLGQAPLLLPEWTDRDESDFGVVLIELFAYAADILSHYQDQVANEAYLPTATQRRSVTELLRLIDYQIDPGLAAVTHLHLAASADVTVDETRLPFAVKTAGRPGEPDATFEVTHPFTLRALNSAIDLSAVTALAAGTAAVALPGTAHALGEGDAIYLEETTTTATGEPRVRHSPLLEVTGVRALDATSDEVTWLPPLAEPFDPASTKLHGNNLLATHGRTITDEPPAIADGTPGQRVRLARGPVTHLLREGAPVRRRSAPEVEVVVDGVAWDEVESLAPSGPSDLHFTTEVDEEDVLTVVFGSGARGAVPPAGARIDLSYRIGLGTVGNVGPDTLTVAVTSLPEVTAVTNPFGATGGADRESIDEARISGPGSVIAQDRAVTLLDHELLAEAFPGVGKAKARVGLRGGYKVVQVFIAPEQPDVIPPVPPADDLRVALASHLEARMPVNRMAGVDVLDPVYVPVDAIVDVRVAAEASRSDVVDAVRGALRELLSFARQDFGVPVRVGEVFSTLHPIEGVSYVELRVLQRRDRPPADDECGFADVPIAEHELAYEGILTVNAFGGLR
jgi:predicted phage baseplate assembly protein